MSAYKIFNYLLLIVIVLLIVGVIGQYTFLKEPYEEEWICSTYHPVNNLSESEYGCKLDSCIVIAENPTVEECYCVLSDTYVQRYCYAEILSRKYVGDLKEVRNEDNFNSFN